MNAAVVAYALAAAAYAGFQLTVRLVVYPQFARVPAAASAQFEQAHQRLVTPLVGLLFGALALTCGGLLLAGPRVEGVVAAVLFGAILAVTAFGAVPAHGVLSRGFDAGTHRRLLRWDTLRVVLALGQLLLGGLTLT
ncbi:MAG TPA: hypothetical protein VE781_13325 [Kineosporiaceae bacterium]|nr:hypothetical protein [Kineosporiaceae bacterium]